ncbi:MAG: N-acetylglucosamine-6-phosphate deacetylase [Syntrophothermus sp.]
MRTLLTGGTILTPDEVLPNHSLIIDGERIVDVRTDMSRLPDDRVIDVTGLYVAPGFMDIHVHGAVGVDTMDATTEAIHRMGEEFARHGVTSFLPTTVAASSSDILQAIQSVASTPPSTTGARHVGIHLEGPYVNHEYRGAQPTQHIRAAEEAEYKVWLDSGQVRLITAAPEVDGVLDLIRAGQQSGVEFAAGHTNATYEQVLSAADLGLRQATHTFNGMPGLNHRTPGPVGAVLSDDRIWAQVIVDGVHVHPAVVKLLIKAKGMDRTILVTDAMRATGMPDGDYALGDQMVHVKDGVARTDRGGLAGSTLAMDQALRNVMEFTGLALVEALPMLTRVPAASIGLEHQKGQLAGGFDADIVVLDSSHQVRMTIVAGTIVYRDL